MENNFANKILPHNSEAEKAVLGAVFFENEALSKALEMVKSEDFYFESHRQIFNCMTELFTLHHPYTRFEKLSPCSEPVTE